MKCNFLYTFILLTGRVIVPIKAELNYGVYFNTNSGSVYPNGDGDPLGTGYDPVSPDVWQDVDKVEILLAQLAHEESALIKTLIIYSFVICRNYFLLTGITLWIIETTRITNARIVVLNLVETTAKRLTPTSLINNLQFKFNTMNASANVMIAMNSTHRR